MKALDTKIVQFIRDKPDLPLIELQQGIKKQFGVMLGVAQVRQVLQTQGTREKIVAVKEQAADGLSNRLDRLTQVEDTLFQMFQDTVVLKDKLEVARELRQYIKQGTDVSGLYDSETDTVFVIGGEWSTESDETDSA